ncbi:FecR domain-containing protein [Methylomicrobium sp. Wu6]|uniref:FecR domain-containing protein n=1 Tax=Methylomicrobium sp. Wu6 TaxID=3107928 RepID=UPI002DD63A63|nr:FecR domain-containing protein [Methylomicrobium sp. Wu6]MEC4747952.1 FecR domain-containing protein [Methylomicrobium sp. Wu6]
MIDMRRKTQRYPLLILLLMHLVVEAAPLCKQPAAKVVSLQGKAKRQYPGNPAWQAVGQDDIFCPGDTLRTEKRSRATLVLSNESLITLDQGSTLIFSEPNMESSPWLLKLLEGVTYFRSRQPQKLNVQTPFINAVHEGTEFLVTVDSRQARIAVFDGQVAATNAAGRIHIKKGQMGTASPNQPPRLQALTVTPTDAVQWALYYPPIIDYRHFATADPLSKAALDAYRQGNVEQALAKLDSISAAAQNADIPALKASLLLTVGRVDEASAVIDQALRLHHDPSILYALQAVIAVAKNQQNAALALARKAEALNPESSVPKIALSYAYQALFKIEDALTAARQAVRLAPEDSLAWARLAELQLSTGNRDDALLAAQKAEQLNPNLARTRTILGFTDLAQANAYAAKRAFEQALALDSSDPIARLGLGLAKIRQGALQEGAHELEIAANLDPNNAVIRSYLGKAYYELRNKGYAGTELNLAKEMDPKDPTPWFYDAILKQTTNRPVAALHDMQEAIALNDNRGVYRSSFLLDKDLAARSAAQGRIYNDLGFQQSGLLEGWKSVNQDSGNYSAHRLLADNYAALPRHEIARVSELLQSQLLQPVNITPIQPNLAESNLFILNGLGPSDLSYNEFNPLFEYNRVTLQTSAVFASNNTLGDNATLSGLHDNTSFSLGQFHYETDGFRENNFLRKDLYNAFLQSQVTDKLNLQAEYRHEESNNGDLTLNFNLDNFFKNFRENQNVDSYRIGGHYEFTPASSLIGSLIYQDININQHRVDPVPPLFIFDKDINLNRSGFISELQHRYTRSNYSILSGFGHIDQEAKDITTGNGTFVPFSQKFPLDSTPNYANIARTNFYNYSTINFLENLSATLGLSVDYYQNSDLRLTPLNPKLGLVWSPTHSTTFRAAAFRSLSVTRTANQTIEPTQVAGFNQFFDDLDGTVAWRFGAGADHKFSEKLSSGVEYSERKLYIPGFSYSVDRSEQTSRAYLYFTPHDWVAVGTEYFYEKIINPVRPVSSINIFSGGLFDEVETHRVPVSFSVFHPSGFSFKIKNSFIHQSGVFQDLTTNSKMPDRSSFFIVDLNLSYRLPKRFGMVSLGINNVFNDQIHYQNTGNNEPILAPGRVLFSRINLAL